MHVYALTHICIIIFGKILPFISTSFLFRMKSGKLEFNIDLEREKEKKSSRKGGRSFLMFI